MGIWFSIHQFVGKYYAFLLFLLGMFLLLLNLWIIQSPWLGIISYIIYAIPVSVAMGQRFRKFGKYISTLFGFLLMNSFFLVSTAILIRSYIPLSKWLLSIVLVLPILFFFYYRYQTPRYALVTREIRIEEGQNLILPDDEARINPWLFHGFFLAIIAMITVLVFSSTDKTVSSLHEVLNPIYYVFNFIAITIVVLVILTKINMKIKLTFVLIYAVASRLFRYLLYEVMTGSDMWRNLSGSIWLNDGGILPPHSSLYLTLASSENAYLGFWGLNVFISQITGISLYSLYPYVGILTAFFVTLILFQISRMLIHNEKIALIVALLTSFLFDTLIWLSLSSANGLGFLMMLFALMMFIATIKNDFDSITTLLLIFLAGIFAYSLTAIYVLFLGLITLSLIKRKRKLTLILSFLFVIVIPSIHFLGIFVEFVVSGTLPNIEFSSLNEIIINMIFFSQRTGLNNILDIPFLLIYLLVGVGLVFGLRRIESPIIYLLMVFLIAAIVGDFYGWWLQIRIYHRIGTTILPWLYLILAGIGIPIINSFIKDNLQTNQTNLTFRQINRFQTKKLLTIGLCLILGFAATINLLYSPNTNSYNPSADLLEALNYISENDNSRNSLILADAYSLIIFDTISHGKWHNLPFMRQSSHALELSHPYYLGILKFPSTLNQSIINASRVLLNYLESSLPQVENLTKGYFVYDQILIQKMYIDVGYQFPDNLLEILIQEFGQPIISTSVWVFSFEINAIIDANF